MQASMVCCSPYSPRGRKESDTTTRQQPGLERSSNDAMYHFFFNFIVCIGV